MKQSGAAISSKFIPPKVPAMFLIVEIISAEFDYLFQYQSVYICKTF